jgi:hypothetical protein
MATKLPPRDPVSSYQRKAKAVRRAGEDARCTSCEEIRPEALIPKSNPMICAQCQRKKRGKTAMDNHHVAGRANSPITTSIPANDHRAELSVAQHDWPKGTLENRDGCPLLRGAACIRGFVDTVLYYMRELLLWIADMLERLSEYVSEKWGRQWWLGTDLEHFAPKGNANAEQ